MEQQQKSSSQSTSKLEYSPTISRNSNPSDKSHKRNRDDEFEDGFYSDDDDEKLNDASEDDFEENKQEQENADPLFDKDGDDNDEKWVQKKMNSHRVASDRVSDAILACPSCFTTLCFDCQRHEQYSTQFRAMFVQNCMVDLRSDLRYRLNPLKSKRQKKKEQFKAIRNAKKKQKKENNKKNNGNGNLNNNVDMADTTTNNVVGNVNNDKNKQLNDSFLQQATNEQKQLDTQFYEQDEEEEEFEPLKNADEIYADDEHLYGAEIYHPVRCKLCNTDVGVVDSDEVYHFFNVLPSDA